MERRFSVISCQTIDREIATLAVYIVRVTGTLKEQGASVRGNWETPRIVQWTMYVLRRREDA